MQSSHAFITICALNQSCMYLRATLVLHRDKGVVYYKNAT